MLDISESERSRRARVPVLSESEAAAVRRGVPDPGISLPRVAAPTVLVWVASLAVWIAATYLVLGDFSRWWLWLTIPVHAFVTFSMFTVLHESTHHAAGRMGWVNELLGRLSMPFVAAWGTYPLIRYVHIEHHRNTNEDIHTDPDAWSEHGPAWQLPLRWMTQDAWYFRFYLPRMARRPRKEVIGLLTNLAAVIAIMIALIATGHGWELVLIYLIPQRLGLGLLAWWFDWLPHHDLGVTAKVNRFQATRIRVGWERLMNPLMFYQNYHLVHHIHPTIPFYRYVQAWQRTEADYLDRGAPIATAWGRELTSAEYRAWREIAERYDSDTVGELVGTDRPRFHSLRVSEVRPLTPEAVSVTFEVPDDLRETYRFLPGQSIVVRHVLDGQELRRNYSICTVASSGVLRIAIKRVDGGRFSHHANTALRPGDALEVMPPTGQFTLTDTPARSRHLAAVAAGSGITPVISILASALTAEPEARATLIYANRTPESTMFGPEIAMLTRQFEGRLKVLHFHSRAEGAEPVPGEQEHESVFGGRLTPARLAELLDTHTNGGRSLAAVDEWYLCGPEELTVEAANILAAQHVPAQHIHRELFVSTNRTELANDSAVVPAKVSVTLDGQTTELTTEGDESLLEAVLRTGLDAPYSCTGGACATCKVSLLRGTVHMEQNYTLSDDDVARGWVLTCQSRPTSDSLHIDYDQ
ncbi:fatty acid desaturase [Rhodococcus sp. NPDC059968]|uniref:fatty acid desaturase n=1 Tax=Rhodococcus sp. NPDC059968 TaxID=3347017 RepID=UPI00366F4CD3